LSVHNSVDLLDEAHANLKHEEVIITSIASLNLKESRICQLGTKFVNLDVEGFNCLVWYLEYQKKSFSNAIQLEYHEQKWKSHIEGFQCLLI